MHYVMTFSQLAESDESFRAELPAFCERIRCLFARAEIQGYFESAERESAIDADLLEGLSVVIETQQDHAMTLERLQRRDPEALAAFLLSLVQERRAVREQVHTFIVGDESAEAAKSVRERIDPAR